MEEWKTIEGFPDYQVSSFGRVFSTKRNKILNMFPDGDGYLRFSAYNNNIRKNIKIHKIVGDLFLQPDESRSEIDHIDGNIKNNTLVNLRRVNRSEQLKNRRCYSRSGEKYIYITKKGYYEFNNKIHRRLFNTLEEAVAFKNSILNQTQA